MLTDDVMLKLSDGEVTPEIIRLLAMGAIGIVVISIVMGGFTFFSGTLAAYTAEGVTLRLRDFLFDHIQRLSFTYHNKTQTGELIQRSTSDVDALRRFFADQAIGVGRILALFLVNFIALLRLNVQLGLFSIILIPLIILVSIFFFRKVSKAYEAYQEQEAVLSTTLQENLSGVRVVKAFARQDYEREKFNIDNWEKYLRGRRLLLMHSGYWPVSDILSGIQMLAGFTLAAVMAINGTITVGDYITYAGLVVWLIWPMRNLGRLIVQTSTGLVSYSRVRDIIITEQENLEDGIYQPVGNCQGDIKFKHIDFQYEDAEQILKDISFHSQPGQIVALLGATGSGKTSLVNLIPRFYEYQSGSITLDGIELNQYPKKYLRQQVGIVEQEPFLFSRTIRENIIYGVSRDVSEDEIQAAAIAAAIHDVILTFPEGYDTLIGERGVTLSGGQKQRIAIARTLLKDPRILILDDATSSVDAETEVAIRNALEYLMHGRTSFIIAHRIQSVMDADIILVLQDGRIVQRGSHAELSSQEGIYQEIFDIQTRIETELEEDLSTIDITHLP
jgi:ATP-binding cassette subfamily B protein